LGGRGVGCHCDQNMPCANLLGVSKAGVALTVVVVLNLLVGGIYLGRQLVGVIADDVERDALGLAELFAMVLVERGDLLVTGRDSRFKVFIRYFDIGYRELQVELVVDLTRFGVAYLDRLANPSAASVAEASRSRTSVSKSEGRMFSLRKADW